MWKEINDAQQVSDDGQLMWKGQLRQTQQKDKFDPVMVRYKTKRHTNLCPLHMIVAKAFIGNTEGFRRVVHINGDLTDNSVDNLKWVSDAEFYASAGPEGRVKRSIAHFKKLQSENKKLRSRLNKQCDETTRLKIMLKEATGDDGRRIGDSDEMKLRKGLNIGELTKELWELSKSDEITNDDWICLTDEQKATYDSLVAKAKGPSGWD